MLLYHARWVVPISRPPIEHGTVGVREGRIAYVGPRSGAPEGSEVDLGEVILLPGLVNAHTHLELTVMRGFLEELSFRDWIRTLTAARRAVLSSDDLLDSARLGVLEGVRAGITTFADTGESGVVVDAMRGLGVRGIAYQEVFGPDPGQCETSVAELRARVAALRLRQTTLVRIGVSPHAPYSVSDALFAATAAFASSESLPMAIHIAEGVEETRLVRDGEGEWAAPLIARGIDVRPRARSPIAMLERSGALAARPLLIHCVQVDDEDLAAMGRHRCAVAHCPVSNAKLGHGVAPLIEMLARGLRVGLGSDSMASNNRMDILEEARQATLAQRALLGRHDVLDAASALRLATLGGAEALGLDGEIGSLDVGKAADLAAFPLDPTRSSPAFSPESALVYSLGGRPASFAVVAGAPLLRDGVLVHPSSDIAARVGRAATRLARWREESARTPP